MSKRGFEYGRMQNTTLYPTDLTDEQWNLLQLALPPRKTRKGRGRPPADLRRICSALLYFVRSGCAWRLLPRDFGPWKTNCHYFWLWTKQGCWKIIHDLLREAVRKAAGKRSQPTAAILDSQTVRSADQAGERGYDAAKKSARDLIAALLLWPLRAGTARGPAQDLNSYLIDFWLILLHRLLSSPKANPA